MLKCYINVPKMYWDSIYSLSREKKMLMSSRCTQIYCDSINYSLIRWKKKNLFKMLYKKQEKQKRPNLSKSCVSMWDFTNIYLPSHHPAVAAATSQPLSVCWSNSSHDFDDLTALISFAQSNSNLFSPNFCLQKGRTASQHLCQTRIAYCLISDDTATILFTACND